MPADAAQHENYCIDLLRQRDKDRLLSALFIDAQKRPAVLALYALNAELAAIAPAVSEPMLGEIRLQWWRETVESAVAGEPRDHPVAQALAATLGGVPADLLIRLIDSRVSDVHGEAAGGVEELEGYAIETAGTLQEAVLRSLGAEEDEARRLARPAGVAWAFFGLLRSHAAHAAPPVLGQERHGRREDIEALQRAMLARASEALSQIRAHKVPPGIRAGLLHLALCDLYEKRLRRHLAETRNAQEPFSEPPVFRKQLRMMSAALRRRF